jgi:hypothetical protein
LFAALCLLATGCRDREVTTYRVPKEKETPPPAAVAAPSGALPPDHPPVGGAGAASAPSAQAAMANTAVPTAGGSNLTWTAPATWTAKPSSAMRKGSYALKRDGAEADLSITAFPGDTGGLHANLNRWRGQVGLSPASAADLDAALVHVDGQGLHFDVIELVGTANGAASRMLGAVTSFGGNSWFFKLLGPDALVAAEKNAFVEFLKTVKAP